MRTSALVRSATLICALTAAAVLAGCSQGSAGSSSPSGSPAPSASATPSAASVALDCGLVLPVERAATALGLPADTLFDPATREAGAQQPNSGAVQIIMEDAAVALGDLLDCSYAAPDNGTVALTDDGSRMLPRVSVRVLRNAADEFTAGEPDSDDGLRGLHSVDLGDTAFVACHPPEHDSCRAEMLVGTTWVNVAVSPQPTEERFVAFAGAVVAAVEAAGSAPVTAAPRLVGCDALLAPADLADALAIDAARPTDYGSPDWGEIGVWPAGQRAAGLLSCGWSSSGSEATSGGVLVNILPGAAAAWNATPPNQANSSIHFEEVTGLGDEAYAGCGGDSCEVDVLSGDVWVLVRYTAGHDGNLPGDLPGAKTLAATALANYLANR